MHGDRQAVEVCFKVIVFKGGGSSDIKSCFSAVVNATGTELKLHFQHSAIQALVHCNGIT